ncbi:cadmium/zinc-transporting ATPase HMA3-like [Punica granatum]|uniref:Cadmium/zinc-transporting ATPase HMA3-like n=1 Tax=Punica granatum TaxID=22663 RepID=A0A6P8CCS8_PUNGR|nr:cadmium/zinc-transporting ATPase HMA3-like [Punica granatum]
MDLDKPLLQSWRTRTGKKELSDKEKGDSGGGPVTKPQKSYFDVLGICCSSEIPLVENILKPIDGVKEVSVIVVSRTVIVVHDSLLISQTELVTALNKARLEASIKGSGEDLHSKKKWPSPYAIASGVLLLLSLLKYMYDPLKWFAVGAVAAGIFPIVLKGLAAFQGLRIDINILVLVTVIGTMALKEYIEAGTIVFLFTIAQWLESRASHKASATMSSLTSIAPQKATIAETGEIVDVHEIQVSTVVAVKPGEVIPIDGVVVDGISEVDEKTLTGESFPVAKQINSLVWAGTINLNGYISVRTTALAEDCVVAQMAKQVEEAQSKKSRTQRLVDEFAKFYTPAVLVISIAVAVIPVVLRVPDQDRWLRLSLVILVSACPCALILSTPVATFCALTKAAEHGLLIKGGDYLEALGKVKTVAFDKTGTITRGEFSVSEFLPVYSEVTLKTLLYWISSIESKSSHPLAAPLVQYARSFSIEPRPEDVEDFQNFPGEGIHGKIDGRDVFIGNKRIAIRAGSDIDPSLLTDVKGGKTVGYVYAGATLVGIFSLSDECRTGVTEAIEQLKSLNIKTAMLTGDTQESAIYAQNQIHNALDLVYAELLPEEKLKIIEELKKDGLTAMVGDGINDAPSLAASNISISMGISGSALAIETSHVILMSNDIGKIPRAVILGRRGQRKVIENVIFSVLTKGVILVLAFAGYPLVWAAVLADTGTCLVVILNSMLLLRENRGDGLGQERCRRSSVPIDENPTADEIFMGQHVCNCCGVNNCGSSAHVENSSLIVRAQIPDSEGQSDCHKSQKCTSERKTLQEKVTCESRCCPSEKDETKCKSRNCCTEKRGNDKATADEISSGQNRRSCHAVNNCVSSVLVENSSLIAQAQVPDSEGQTACCRSGKCSSEQNSLQERVTCESRCFPSEQHKTKSVTCQSTNCCSGKRGDDKPSADEISLGQNHRKCCNVYTCSSSVLLENSSLNAQAQPPDSEGQWNSCMSGKCPSKQKSLQEKVTCDSGCCSSEKYEAKLVSCKSTNCCSKKRGAEKPTADEISLGQNHRNCSAVSNCGSSIIVEDSSLIPQAQIPNNEGQSICCKSEKGLAEGQGLHQKVACESRGCPSEQSETKVVSCKSKNCCSEKRGDKEQHSTEHVISSCEATDISYSSSVHSGSKSTESVDTGCCSRGKCSKTKGNVPSVYSSVHLEESNLNARGKSVLGHMKLVQGGNDIKSGQVQEETILMVETNQVSGCCKNSYPKECGRSCCLSEIVTV